MVPTVEFPPTMPFTFQMIPVSVVFCTVAVKARVLPTRTVALVGEMVTLTGGGGGGGLVTVTVAVPATGGVVLLVAVTVTGPEGTLDGAV